MSPTGLLPKSTDENIPEVVDSNSSLALRRVMRVETKGRRQIFIYFHVFYGRTEKECFKRIQLREVVDDATIAPSFSLSVKIQFHQKTNLWTNRPTSQRTKPLIEMRGKI